jgi:hypothetical protein
MGAAAPLFTASFFARSLIHHTKAFYYNRVYGYYCIAKNMQKYAFIGT